MLLLGEQNIDAVLSSGEGNARQGRSGHVWRGLELGGRSRR